MDCSSKSDSKLLIMNHDSESTRESQNEMESSPELEEMLSENMMLQYQDLVSEHAQAAAVRMIGLADISECSKSTQSSTAISDHTHSLDTGVSNKHGISTREIHCDENSLQGSDPLKSAKSTTNAKNKKIAKDKDYKYKCTHCSYVSKWSHALANHMRAHNDTEFKCCYCEYSTTWKSDLTNHMRVHTGDTFNCTECGYRCIRKQGLVKHMRIHSGVKPYKCSQCEYSSTQSANLKKHMLKHSTIKPFSCDYCKYSCRQLSLLRRHVHHHHSTTIDNSKQDIGESVVDEVLYRCQLCRQELDSADKYLHHTLSKHILTNDNRCYYICLKSYDNKQQLINHQLQHSNDGSITREIGVNTDQLNHIPEVCKL